MNDTIVFVPLQSDETGAPCHTVHVTQVSFGNGSTDLPITSVRIDDSTRYQAVPMRWIDPIWADSGE